MTEQVFKSRLTARIDLMISTFRLRKVLNQQAVRSTQSNQGAVSQNRIVQFAIDECDVAVRKLKLLKGNVAKVGSTELMQLLTNYGQYSYEGLEKKLEDF